RRDRRDRKPEKEEDGPRQQEEGASFSPAASVSQAGWSKGSKVHPLSARETSERTGSSSGIMRTVPSNNEPACKPADGSRGRDRERGTRRSGPSSRPRNEKVAAGGTAGRLGGIRPMLMPCTCGRGVRYVRGHAARTPDLLKKRSRCPPKQALTERRRNMGSFRRRLGCLEAETGAEK
ncbi:hypothetical protein THAOC_29310, partial [Thalassiosira oceanica]